MIDHLITVLIFGILILSFTQKSYNDAFVAAAFASGIWAHEILFSHLNNAYYFLSAGMLDTIVILLILRFKSNLSIPLSVVSLMSIIVNFIGLYLWWNFYEPIAYNSLILGIYCMSIYILVGGKYGPIGVYRGAFTSFSSWFESFLLHKAKDSKK